MSAVAINSKRDALIWRCVDRCFSGDDPRQAIADLELDLTRLSAARYIGLDWLLDVLRETAVEA
jgi:hypothetical protein